MKAQSTIRNSHFAFTLIELLAVITIIGILAGIVLGIARYAQRREANSRAQAEIKAVELAIEGFRLDTGAYPTSTIYRLSFNSAAQQTNSWLLYTQLAGGSKKYFTFSKNQLASSGGLTIIVDPFGTPYAYFCPVSNVTRFVDNVASNEVGGLVNKVSFDLFSFGSDSATYVSGSTWATDPARSVDDITNWK